MFDFTDFQQVFPAGTQLPYDKKLQTSIEAHRKGYDGTLFIDRVLKALGITKGQFVSSHMRCSSLLTISLSESVSP